MKKKIILVLLSSITLFNGCFATNQQRDSTSNTIKILREDSVKVRSITTFGNIKPVDYSSSIIKPELKTYSSTHKSINIVKNKVENQANQVLNSTMNNWLD